MLALRTRARCGTSIGLALAAALLLVAPAAGQNVCPDPDELTQRPYTVSNVRIRTPLWFSSKSLDRLFFGKVEDIMQADLETFPISTGQRFSRASYNAGLTQLTMLQVRRGMQIVNPAVRVRTAVIVPSVTNCVAPTKTAAGSVEVVYNIYTTDASY